MEQPSILDPSGVIQGAKGGEDRSRQVITVAKTCHLLHSSWRDSVQWSSHPCLTFQAPFKEQSMVKTAIVKS